jgi:TetR/AcrR family transcriptional regulator, transcriptional repressor of aconitase
VPKRSQEHLDARREQILHGARRAFARFGYEGATVAVLEQETGLSRGAIFNYFPSKWEIFYAIAQREHARASEIWLEEGFEGLLRHVVEQDPDWLGVYLEHVQRLRTDEALRRQWEQKDPDVERRLMDRMRELQAAGEVRGDLAPQEIAQFLGIVLDGVVLQISAGFPVDVEPVLRLVRDVVAPRT